MIRLLYVDDEASCLKLVKIFLEETGEFAVDTVTSVREAMNKLASGNYDALISDYSMPESDGLEFLHLVREKDDSIPFLLFSGRSRGRSSSRRTMAGRRSSCRRGTISIRSS
jgi:DNA-binding NtrC family response regulator